MVMFAEGDYNPAELADLYDELYGPQDPNEINLIEGIDDEAITIKGLPPETPADE